MKKTYWWRLAVLFVGSVCLASGYLIFYPYRYGLCKQESSFCVFGSLKRTFAEPLFLMSLSMIVVALILFFVSDNVFKKWLKFAIIFLIVSLILIALTPVSYNSFFSMNPERETVSIWMSALFAVLSLVLIIWQSIKEKKNKIS